MFGGSTKCKGVLHMVGTTTQRITAQVEARVDTSVVHTQVLGGPGGGRGRGGWWNLRVDRRRSPFSC